MAITPDGLNEIAQAISTIIEKINYKQNDISKSKNITGAIPTNGLIDIVLTLDENENGTFTEFEIVSKSGKIISRNSNAFTKTQGIIALKIKFKIQEV